MAHPKRIQRMLKKYGLSGVNKPKKTPSNKKSSHVVLAFSKGTYKLIRFGQQGVSGAGKRRKGESKATTARRKAFKARHAKNIKKGRLSAAYWANLVKW